MSSSIDFCHQIRLPRLCSREELYKRRIMGEKLPMNSLMKNATINSNADVGYRYNREVTLAKQLACAASTSAYLRERIDGIIIDIASDDRATPGLEVCVDAISRGPKERRKCGGARRRQVRQQHRGRRNDSDASGGGDTST